MRRFKGGSQGKKGLDPVMQCTGGRGGGAGVGPPVSPPLTYKACRPFILFYAVIGTLRPDLIESASSLASSKADAIKTHHNDTELVRNLRAKVSTQKS